ncbi:MAG: phosphoglycerate kinase [Nanoarchaeota archaeon]|nr:phosphoglycerate kinase [Nanoarchaeota archaeon]
MDFRTVKDGDFAGKKVILRCDLDVPLDGSGEITDDSRLRRSLGTIQHLLIKNASQIIIIGHVDRPKGQIVEKLKTKKVAERLQKLSNLKINYIDKCFDVQLPSAKLLMLENLRFYAGEETNDEGFAKKLASLGDVYVNDAFAASHRSHASVDAITKFLPSYAGLNLAYEIETLTDLLENPAHPFMAVMGGAKLETKIPVIKNLLPKIDKILIGGSMVFSFFKSLDLEVGRSAVNDEVIALAKETLVNSKDKIILPEEIVVTDDLNNPTEIEMVQFNEIPRDRYGADIGPEAIAKFQEILEDAKTIVWNGPMGVYEKEEFAKGTQMLAKVLSQLNAKVIVGGGDSAAAIERLGLKDKFAYISSGGGASLALLGGKELPALKALEENKKNFS